MVILVGVMQKGSQFTGVNPNLSSDNRTFDKITWPYTRAMDSFKRGASTYVRKANVSIPAQRVLSASRLGSYFNDYYHRIHIAPAVIPLGDITSNQLRNVEVWNANLTPRQLTSIGVSGDATGVNLIQPQPAPTTYVATESRIYQVGVTLNGSPNVDIAYQFNFVGQTSELKVTGRRVVLFPYKPNFKMPFTETLEWRTDVMRAFSGKEQRRGLSTVPRRGFEFDIQLSGEETQYWQNLMWGWQERVFALPVWVDSTVLNSNANMGSLVIECNTTNLSFTNSGILTIYLDEHNSETCEIESFTTSAIVLKQPLLNTWPAGTHVYPCVFAHLPTEIPTTRHTSNVVSARCTFKTSPDVTAPNIANTPAPTIYDGLEVITVQPDWVNGLGQNVSHEFEEIDYGVGQIRWLNKEKNPSKILPYSWLLRDRNMVAAFRAFLGRQFGQLKTCWVPSWTDDFTAMFLIDESSTILPVKENGFARLVGVNPANDRIAIYTKSGQVFYRRITAVTLSPDGVNSALVLDSPLGVRLLADDILTINTLHRCRFATDKFNLQWHTNTVVTIDSNFKTVDQ